MLFKHTRCIAEHNIHLQLADEGVFLDIFSAGDLIYPRVDNGYIQVTGYGMRYHFIVVFSPDDAAGKNLDVSHLFYDSRFRLWLMKLISCTSFENELPITSP